MLYVPDWVSFCREDFNVRNHAAIENGVAIRSTIVDTISTKEDLVQVESNLFGNSGHLWQYFLFVPIAWGGNQKGNNMTVAIAFVTSFFLTFVL